MKKTPLLKFYSVATRMAAPVLPFWLNHRARRGKEELARLGERSGITTVARPDAKLIWFHAASVGESQMLLPVIARILAEHPDFHMVVTTGTVTSAHLLAQQLPDGAVHQYAPADHPRAVKNFLNHWRPDLAIFAESELWPNMIMQTKARGIALALINARMSSASLRRWAKGGQQSVRALLACFDLILAADIATATGLAHLSGREIETVGNLKDAAAALTVDKAVLKKLKAAIGARPVWCAASTHKGEEALIADAVLRIKAKKPRSLLILAPRHPHRAKEVEGIFTSAGLNVVCYSARHMPTDKTDIYLVDQIGKMGLVYTLSKIAFVAGSLLEGLSGHNPLEPAKLGCAVITGAHTSSFADTYTSMLTVEAADRILSPEQLAPTVLKYMADVKARRARADAALKYADSRDTVLDNVWTFLSPWLLKED